MPPPGCALLLLFSTLSAAYRLCSNSTGHVEMVQLRATPLSPVPGRQLCLAYKARLSVPLTVGWSIHVSHKLFGDLDFDACQARSGRRLQSVLDTPCPVAPGINVSGSFCFTVPLAAMVHATERVDVTVAWADSAAKPMACYRETLTIAGEVSVDFDVEATASQARLSLRRALSEQQGAADAVQPLLHAAYEAQPEWAEAFAAWRRLHRKEWTSPTAEAAAYQTFRENVIAVVRAGRPLTLDDRFDMGADARRTLSHFA